MIVVALSAEVRRVPLGKAARIPLNDPRPAGPDAVDLVTVQLETDTGIAGFGFATVFGPGAELVRTLIDAELAPLAIGEHLRDTERLFAKAEARFRSIGFSGLPARAYSAIDIALWDAKARAASVPLFQLLGNARASAPYFVSDLGSPGRSSADVLKAAKAQMKQGATGVRLEIGGGDVQADAERIRDISDGLGEEAWVGVAADGRFDLGTAQALSHFFEDIGIDWFEDPIPATDEPGYAKLASLMEVPLAVGSGFGSAAEFFRVIRSGVVRTVRPDLGRIGGITPLLKIAAVAEAFHVAVSPVRLPEVGVHLACGLGVVTQVDAVNWFADVFAGGPTIADGKMVPPQTAGLGLLLKR